VTVTGPQVAAADAKIMAEVMHKLTLSIKEAGPVLSPEAGAELIKKAWEDFMGTPWRPELDAALDKGDTETAAAIVEDSGEETAPARQLLAG